MPLTAVINYVFAFIFAVLSSVSVIGQGLVSQSWSHSHSLNTFHFSKFQLYYMAVVEHYSKVRSAQ